MSIFHKKRPSGSGSLHSKTDSLPSREALTAPHPSSRAAGPRVHAQAGGIGVQKLLETYDDYHHLVSVLEATEADLRVSEERAELAERERAQLVEDLQEEQEGRKADKAAAADRLDVEVAGRKDDGVKAKEALAAAEKAREKKIRDELEPKVADLEKRLAEEKEARAKVQAELDERRNGMQTWIDKMDGIHRSRQAAVDKEVAAAAERKKADEGLNELHEGILKGMRDWVAGKSVASGTLDAPKDKTTAAKTGTTTTTSTTPFGASSTPKKERVWDEELAR